METRICFISRRTTRPHRLCTPRSLLNLEFLPETRCMCFQSFWAHGCCISYFKSNVRETWRVILVSKADIFVAAHSFRAHQRDFTDASHFKSAKSAIDTISYGIFSSENSYLQLKERHPRIHSRADALFYNSSINSLSR